jgi:hypothetical protein
MPRTAEDVETYLLQLDRRFEQDGGNLLLTSPGRPTIAVRVAPPIVALRVTIGEAPSDPTHQLAVYRRMLELNANDLMHVSYGVEGNSIVLTGALPLENLDLNELEAALSDIDLAISRQVPELHKIKGIEGAAS